MISKCQTRPFPKEKLMIPVYLQVLDPSTGIRSNVGFQDLGLTTVNGQLCYFDKETGKLFSICRISTIMDLIERNKEDGLSS